MEVNVASDETDEFIASDGPEVGAIDGKTDELVGRESVSVDVVGVLAGPSAATELLVGTTTTTGDVVASIDVNVELGASGRPDADVVGAAATLAFETCA